MLKIKIPPRSEPEEKTDAVPLKTESEDSDLAHFRDWWQEEFEELADFLEYDAGQYQNAIALANMIENFVWPDFKVVAEGSSVVFRRVEERYFPRKNKIEISKVNTKMSYQ